MRFYYTFGIVYIYLEIYKIYHIHKTRANGYSQNPGTFKNLHLIIIIQL